MVNIDTVYQKVLMFANKEQRGYVTPQEFNLFADQAQLEIFEQYFYDVNFYLLKLGNTKEYSDIRDNLNEKISIFETTGTISSGTLPSDLYRLGTVITDDSIEVEEVQQNEILYLNQSPLTTPSASRPVYVRTSGSTIEVTPSGTTVTCTYIYKPTKPNWGYVVVNGKAMYDSGQVNHFELHPSEENELVYKILKFAGLSMKRDDIAQGGQGLEMMQVQQEKQ
jgi:hypothetical protein|tara:strand:+ start:181 stop:849 length:669 start_codon:yes stop_codon:yes gene_type:complete